MRQEMPSVDNPERVVEIIDYLPEKEYVNMADVEKYVGQAFTSRDRALSA